MAESPEKSLLVKDKESQRNSAAHDGCSTRSALMIAGLASFLCLMLCCHIVSIYMIIRQSILIQSLQESKDEIHGQLKQLSRVDNKLSMWIVEDHVNQQEQRLQDHKTSNSHPNHTDVIIVEKLLRGLLQDLKLPQFNETFPDNLQSLKLQMNESVWRSFETWMQNWLIFQMAQQPPAVNISLPTSATKTKCQTEAEAALGSYKPQCDWRGRYQSTQCYGSTGYCWCVDGSGKIIQSTLMQGRPNCWNQYQTRRPNSYMDYDLE